MRIIRPVKKSKRSSGGSSVDDGPSGFEVLDSHELDLSAPANKRKASRTKISETTRLTPTGSKKRSKRSVSGFVTDPFDAAPDQPEVEDYSVASEPLIDLKKEYNRLLNSGVRLLGMREHSVKEVFDKLNRKTDYVDIVNAVLDELLENKYVSDERFTESYIRYRSNRGFGPVKIRAELKNKGISNALISEYLDMGSAAWIDKAIEQYQKKYGAEGVSDYNAWTKRARFMQSRGFTMEHIQVALPTIEFD